MRILFFDTETTGLPKKFNAPTRDTDNWPRLVQLAYIVQDENGKTLHSSSEIICPEGFVIPKEASAVHGITTVDAVHEKYGGEDVEIETSDLLPGQLHYLTEYMECDVPLDEEFPIQVAETLSKAVAMASRDYYKSISDK